MIYIYIYLHFSAFVQLIVNSTHTRYSLRNPFIWIFRTKISSISLSIINMKYLTWCHPGGGVAWYEMLPY